MDKNFCFELEGVMPSIFLANTKCNLKLRNCKDRMIEISRLYAMIM